MTNSKSKLFLAVQYAAIIAFVLLCIESLENYIFFANYFPRGKVFGLIFNKILLKFITLPILQLAIVSFLIYLSFIFFLVYIILQINARLKLHNSRERATFFLFSALSIYLALYMCYGVNAFLHPRSQIQHFILYLFIFPKANLPFLFYIIGAYWSGLFIFAIIVARRKLPLILSFLMIISVILFSKWHSNFVNVKTFKKTNNVILIGIDSLQYNRLCKEWGYEKDLAPNACKFLKKSVCFTNAWSPFARTYPAYSSILTGRYPINNGVRANLLTDHYINPTNCYLGDILKKRGYYRFHCTDDVRFSNIREMHGFDEVFCPRKDVAGFLVTAFFDYAFCNIMLQEQILPWLFSPVIYNRGHVAYNPRLFIQAVIKRINALPENKRQFIVIHLCANHHPYSAPYPYSRNPELVNSSERCIRMADEQLKILLWYLKKCGLYDRSIVVLLSDHGDGWNYNHPLRTHGSTFYYPWANRMILAFRFRDNPRKKINALVRSVDIYPTILEKLNIGVAENIDGESLIPLINGEEEPPRNFFAETGYYFQFNYEEHPLQANRGVRPELKHFRIDPETGYVYLQDKDYKEIIRKKWYMIIEERARLAYSPCLNTTVLYRIDAKTGKDIEQIKNLDTERTKRLFTKLKRFFKL
ncbi:MAG: sulfatase-like hydrolase/transferase [Candidatus Omnitrophota bacterium]|nr:MAG: sulfatase-like hydrolase/transferase [Candidatus Omnitrophota bacterium]